MMSSSSCEWQVRNRAVICSIKTTTTRMSLVSRALMSSSPRDEKSNCTCVQPQSLSDLSASHSSTSTPSASSDICRQNEMSNSCRLAAQNSFSARSDASVVSCASAVNARVNTNKH